MEENIKSDLGELLNVLSETWKGALISAGIKAGIFSAINGEKPATLEEISRKLQYDEDKLEKWFYYAKRAGLVENSAGGYFLTPKSKLLMPDSPFKDLVGFVRITDYFLDAAVNANESFRTNRSLDKLAEGKITRDYQPKVSDNLSAVMFDIFKQYHIGGGETLLDIGCGSGSFLRTLSKLIPEILITGLDSNLFAIELGKKENKQFGLSDRIKMIVGDAAEDLLEFKDASFDWVTCINVFHFFPVKYREALVDEMIRISRKGIFMTEVLIETTPLSAGANPLMALLWNDFTGFFKQDEADSLNSNIEKKYRNCNLVKYPILQNSSFLVAVTKKEYDI